MRLDAIQTCLEQRVKQPSRPICLFRNILMKLAF
jgi:hypothetical protein